MRKTFLALLSTTALVMGVSAAGAADLPRRAAIAEQQMVAPAAYFSWTGFYIGLNAGAGFTDHRNDAIRFAPGSISGSAATNGTLRLHDRNNDVGFVGGGQIGYNWQFNPGPSVVLGVEADIQYADLGREDRVKSYTFTGTPGAAFAPPPATVVRSRGHDDWFGTVRGRLGYAWDRVLVYGTGGLAFGGGEDSDIGYAAGGGVEWAWSNNITLKLEALYVDLSGDDKGRGGSPVYNAGTNTLFLNGADRRRNDFLVARAGLNWKF